MAARRLILAMLVLLVLSTILATLVPVETDRQRDESSSSTTTEPASPPPPSGKLVRRTIAVDARKAERIDLARGDQLELTVTSSKVADRVEIPAFGDGDFVDPEFPAHFDLLALEVGSFPVRLVEAERVIARIEVAAGQARRRSGSSKDAPGSSNRSSDSGASSAS